MILEVPSNPSLSMILGSKSFKQVKLKKGTELLFSTSAQSDSLADPLYISDTSVVFSSVFEKDPNGVDSTVSSNHRTRNLLEVSASKAPRPAQKIPFDIISEKINR